MERYSRADVSAGHVEVGNGFTEEADDTDQAAGVEAGAIATVEADATTAKTIGTELSRGSGIPIDDGGDTGLESTEVEREFTDSSIDTATSRSTEQATQEMTG